MQVAPGPDGYVSLLGTDGATVPPRRWQDKVQRYLVCFRSPVFANRHKATNPTRVLAVTSSAERLANTRRETEKAGGQTWFWFSTYAAIADPTDMLHRTLWLLAGRVEPVGFPYPCRAVEALQACDLEHGRLARE